MSEMRGSNLAYDTLLDNAERMLSWSPEVWSETSSTFDFSDGDEPQGSASFHSAPVAAAGIIQGTERRDVIVGSIGSDTIFANGGNDFVNGKGGSDYIRGGLGIDVLKGASGNDWLQGENGADKLYGGTGKDYFVIRHYTDESSGGYDEIMDWRPSQDVIMMGIEDGDSGNYVEVATTATTAAAAHNQAVPLFSGRIQYAFLYNASTDTGFIMSGWDGAVIHGAGSAADMNWSNIDSDV